MSKIKSSFSWGQNLLASILTLIAAIILPILLLFVVLPTFIVRKIVARLGLIVHPEFTKILTHRSTNLCLEEFHAHTENAILSDYVMEGNYPLESFKTIFSERVLDTKLTNGELKYPELRQFAVRWMDFKFWRHEDNFDINDHIRLYNDSRPSGSDGVVTQKEFHAMRSTLLNSAYPKNKSPWEIVLVHNYESDDPVLKARTDKPLSVLSIKIHHALGDGISIKKLMTLQLCGNQEVEKAPSNKNIKINVNSSFCSTTLKSFWNCLSFPIRCLYEFMIKSILLMKKSPWHVAKGKEAPAVHAFTKILSVARVKWIKDQLGVSFSCILFHVCNEAMQKMTVKKGMELSDSLVAIIPLPLPNHPDKLRNHMTHGGIHLPTSPELTSQQRLKLIHRQYEQLRSSTLPFSMAWLSLIVGGMFTSLGRLLAKGLVPPVVISSFPGSLHDNWNLDGHKCLSNCFNTGLLNISGLAFAILTTGNDMKFGVTASSNILNEDDIQEFAHMLEEEFNILENEIIPDNVSIAETSQRLMPRVDEAQDNV